MIIVGAKGMARELLEIVASELKLSDKDILFFDNINTTDRYIDNRFKVLRTDEEVRAHFSNGDKSFCLGLGNPKHRKAMANKFIGLGGILTTVISKKAHIGSFGNKIGEGCIIMQGAIITSDVVLGKGVLINVNSSISHDSKVDEFAEIACNVTIPGRCTIGAQSFLGSSVVLNPDIVIGDNAVVGSGSVVIKDVPPNAVVVGNPSKIIGNNE